MTTMRLEDAIHKSVDICGSRVEMINDQIDKIASQDNNADEEQHPLEGFEW